MPVEDSEKNEEQQIENALSFFEAAARAIDNYNYAIDMYLNGLRCAPDAVLEGHIKLRELAIQRQARGGRKPSIIEKVKFLRGKTPIEQMLNAEYLFTKNPDNLQYAEAMLKAAVAGNYKKTAKWIADLLFQANSGAEKPSFHTYLLLKDSYEVVGQLDRAIVACQFAMKVRPGTKELEEEYKRLTTELTVSQGKYDIAEDFRESIRDKETQEKLQSQESIVKTESYTISEVESARKALAQEPNLARNIFNLAEALSETEIEQAENEAIELLENAYKTKKDFSFKQRAGQIKIKQLRRKIREAPPFLSSTEDRGAELTAQLNGFELEYYRLCVDNYPTDLEMKYEYGVRLMQNKQYDDAIPLLQEAKKDPRHKIAAMNQTGLCFFLKGWLQDAGDIFEQAIGAYEIKDDDTAKELRYNLARCYEEQGQTEKALEIYRRIAQLAFAYKDVRQRIDKIRNR